MKKFNDKAVNGKAVNGRATNSKSVYGQRSNDQRANSQNDRIQRDGTSTDKTTTDRTRTASTKTASTKTDRAQTTTDKRSSSKPYSSKPYSGKSLNDKSSNERSSSDKFSDKKNNATKSNTSQSPIGKNSRNKTTVTQNNITKTGVNKTSPNKTNSNKAHAKRVNDSSEKLQKVLANLGHGSRREVEALLTDGKVSVNGKIATLGDRVDVSTLPKIRLNGHVIELRQKEKEISRVLAYYKPEGEICSRNDPQGRATVFERLPKLKNARWINIGRLDINTSGLLLFTTDGELANRLMHPRNEVEREYAVRVFGQVTDQQIFQLKRGVQLEDGPASFKSIKSQGGEGVNQWFNVIITEGRNREVRRMWEAVGVQVSRLIRVRYGNITLPKGLSRGIWTELGLNSVNYLRELVGLSAEEKSFIAVDKNEKVKRMRLKKPESSGRPSSRR